MLMLQSAKREVDLAYRLSVINRQIAEDTQPAHEPGVVGTMTTVLNLFHPDPKQVFWQDIVTGQSRINRYNGHYSLEKLTTDQTREWTVADHTVMVLDILIEYVSATSCKPRHPRADEILAEGLLHDSPEAYIGDQVSPLKRMIAKTIKPIENRMASAIRIAFGCTPEIDDEIKHIVKMADELAYLIEISTIRPTRSHFIDAGVGRRSMDMLNDLRWDEPDTFKRMASVGFILDIDPKAKLAAAFGSTFPALRGEVETWLVERAAISELGDTPST